MKVRELIKLLESCDPNQEVHFSYNYGDHWRTRVAPKVSTFNSEAQVKYSSYYDSDVVASEDADPHEEEVKECTTVVLLS